jgi:hypothetical protein
LVALPPELLVLLFPPVVESSKVEPPTVVNGPEQCDDGHSIAVGYNVSGCGPGCKLASSCGELNY